MSCDRTDLERWVSRRAAQPLPVGRGQYLLLEGLAGREPDVVSAVQRDDGLRRRFTVSCLRIDGRLAKTLITFNPVESMTSIARTTDRHATRCRDGHMVLRWTTAGMLNANRSVRRIEGYEQMPLLVPACSPRDSSGDRRCRAGA